VYNIKVITECGILENLLKLKLSGSYSGDYEQGQRSRYSVWLRARRPRDRSSSADVVKNFLFSTSFRPTLVLTQPPT
jgi:hypothetical protein